MRGVCKGLLSGRGKSGVLVKSVRFSRVGLAVLLLSQIPMSLWTPSSSAAPVYGKIAFSRQQTGDDWDIWIMNVDGSGQTKLLDSSFKDSDPHFRYDGTKIVFGRFIPGFPPSEDIYVMNSDGTGVSCLTSDFANDASQPKFSWDGMKIVFTVNVGFENHDIYVMNSDGSGRAALVTGGNNDVWPSFSPDSQYVVFMRFVGSPANQRSKICRYSISTGTVTDLTDGSNLDEMPVYSPDGAYVIFKRGTTALDIYRFRLSDSTLINLTNSPSENEDAPMYSYEGDKIACLSSPAAGGGMSTAEIWTMNSDGTNRKQLTTNSVADFNPTFSPAAPPFDFSLSNSGGITVAQGSSGWNTITVTLISGTSQGVTLSASGLPSGASASFNPVSGNPTFSSSLTITASSITPAGSYTVTVNGTGGGLTRTTSFTLTISRPTLSQISGAILNAAKNTVYFIRTGNMYDDSALGFIYSKCINSQNIIIQTDSSKINQTTGAPLFTGNMVLFGGRAASKVVKYYEDGGYALVTFSANATHYRFMRGSMRVYSVAISTYNPSNADYFVMQIYMEGSRTVFSMWGIEKEGTYASGIYFTDTICPNLASYTQGYLVCKWTDLNNDGIQQSNEISVVASGT